MFFFSSFFQGVKFWLLKLDQCEKGQEELFGCELVSASNQQWGERGEERGEGRRKGKEGVAVVDESQWENRGGAIVEEKPRLVSHTVWACREVKRELKSEVI